MVTLFQHFSCTQNLIPVCTYTYNSLTPFTAHFTISPFTPAIPLDGTCYLTHNIFFRKFPVLLPLISTLDQHLNSI